MMFLALNLEETVERLSPFIAAIFLLIGLLVAEKRKEKKRQVVLKSSLSALYVFTALWQPCQNLAYFYYIVAALVLDMIGDFLLALRAWRAFKIGFFFFLAGHLFYILSFGVITELEGWINLSIPFVVVFLVFVHRSLRSHLGAMRWPVQVYMLVIGTMVVGAFAVLQNLGIGSQGARVVVLGALLVFVSDLFVARQRFVEERFQNRLFGLPLYYLGQFLLAFSVGLIR